ncbi:hypothetical protein QBC46DRAFT_390162 [Diplogelasinospora grovesii]|uniref:Rhodopsin domain-containing protein n=1 Tax=Diplogelasinospora grovesii TaxID=303347 RepID=A0AAN6N3E5_9PEZI|nr:hypothetical protein QBC46DRAFT_390162 [Diplogelasinospora grovesii]
MASGAAPPPLPPNLPHDSLQANIIASSVVCFVISAVFVALRFYTRGKIIRVLGPTDWCILAALIFAAATTAGVIEQAVRGSGRHVWDLDPTDTADSIGWGRAAWYGILFYLLTLCFSKLSIVLLYIHLFTFNWARRAGQILLGLVIVTNIYMVIITVTACIPLAAYWDPSVKAKYCHSQSIWWSNTGLHMATDFLIFLLPMPVVWILMLPRRQKFILFGVFGLGFVVCFISILRLLQLIQVENYPNVDFTYSAAQLSYLTAVEINGAIICACVMTLKPFISRFWPRLLSSRGTDTRRSYAAAGPPTIGSRPSKAPISPSTMDSVIMGKSGVGSGGYMELDDSYWTADVELAEHTHTDGHGINRDKDRHGNGNGNGNGQHQGHGGTTERQPEITKKVDAWMDKTQPPERIS